MKYLLLILSGLMACTSIATDIYLPAMPTMERELGGNAEYTITGFLIGFAVAQLVWGAISDRIGRKRPLFIGVLLFIIGSVGCAISQTMQEVVIWRVFQAIGACVGPMISRTMIRDLYERSKAAEMLSTLMIIMAIAPIVGPLLGGFIVKHSTWNVIFWLMATIGVVLLLSVFKLPETLPIEKRAQGSLWLTFVNYSKLLRNRPFMAYTLTITFFYVAAYAFITGSSFVYIDYFHIDPQYYGLLFGLNIVGVMLLSAFNRRLVKHYSLDQLLVRSSLTALAGAILLLIFTQLQWGGVLAIILPMFLIFSMNGILSACTNAAALDSASSDTVGSAAALVGALQYGSGIISSVLLALFSTGTPRTMVWIIVSFVFLSTLVALTRAKHN